MTNVVNNVASTMRNFDSSPKMGVDFCVELRKQFFYPDFLKPQMNFWHLVRYKHIGDWLLVKRHRNGAYDYVHLAKITTYGRSLLKILTSIVEFHLISRMEGLLVKIEVDESGKCHYSGIIEPTHLDNLVYVDAAAFLTQITNLIARNKNLN